MTLFSLSGLQGIFALHEPDIIAVRRHTPLRVTKEGQPVPVVAPENAEAGFIAFDTNPGARYLLTADTP